MPKQRGGVLSIWVPHITIRANRTEAVSGSRQDGESRSGGVEAAVRQALACLGGRWTAAIAPIEAYCVEIRAPDGFRWLAFVPEPSGRRARTIASRLIEICRHRPRATGRSRWRGRWILVAAE